MKLYFTHVILTVILISFISGCSEKEDENDPNFRFDFRIDSIYNVTQTSATIRATLHTNGCKSDIKELHIDLSKSEDDEIKSYPFKNNQGTVELTLTNLEPNTVYYMSPGVTINYTSFVLGDGVEVSFMTHGERPSSGTVTDYDGNVYHYATIGNQIWMLENLRTTHFRNGDPIFHITTDSLWETSFLDGGYADYNYDASLGKQYGHLYSTRLCYKFITPPGWHVPTVSDLRTLSDYLAKNESNKDFNALLGGYRSMWGFAGLGFDAYFWSSTLINPNFNGFEQDYFYYDYNTNSIDELNGIEGMYIRCIRDN